MKKGHHIDATKAQCHDHHTGTAMDTSSDQPITPAGRQHKSSSMQDACVSFLTKRNQELTSELVEATIKTADLETKIANMETQLSTAHTVFSLHQACANKQISDLVAKLETTLGAFHSKAEELRELAAYKQRVFELEKQMDFFADSTASGFAALTVEDQRATLLGMLDTMEKLVSTQVKKYDVKTQFALMRAFFGNVGPKPQSNRYNKTVRALHRHVALCSPKSAAILSTALYSMMPSMSTTTKGIHKLLKKIGCQGAGLQKHLPCLIDKYFEGWKYKDDTLDKLVMGPLFVGYDGVSVNPLMSPMLVDKQMTMLGLTIDVTEEENKRIVNAHLSHGMSTEDLQARLREATATSQLVFTISAPYIGAPKMVISIIGNRQRYTKDDIKKWVEEIVTACAEHDIPISMIFSDHAASQVKLAREYNCNPQWATPPTLPDSMPKAQRDKILREHDELKEIFTRCKEKHVDWNLFFSYMSAGTIMMANYDPLHGLGVFRQSVLNLFRVFVCRTGQSHVMTDMPCCMLPTCEMSSPTSTLPRWPFLPSMPKTRSRPARWFVQLWGGR